ncbi:putative integral membrane protein linked to a cation pump [Ruegeria denitrificans]|uniref:Putative integral membrane protein linked to a cation pump n=1 Tax=Ruegeria denitrificans TaxID=1715692 RepID=A0A0P1INZ3_9RHOB|nr:FixH family protein [Ruegeria denitrificans]CUK11013.1 putative integral membrane protein linked to a cation pump [Ruegeria denitrificans]
MAERKFTGKHFLAIFVASFGVIIAVNLTLAYNAVKTFPGLEVKNSYVASQEFNERLKEHQALGWTIHAEVSGGLLILHIIDKTGAPIEVAELQAVVGRATHVEDDFSPDFIFDGQAYATPAVLGKGNWNIRLVAKDSTGAEFAQRVPLYVKG